MAKKLEFEARMNVDDAIKSLEGLEKKAEQSFKRLQSLANKQTQKNQEAMQLRQRADDSKSKQASYKQLAQGARGAQKKAYTNEANLWGEDAKAALAGAKEAEKVAATATKEIEKEVAAYNSLQEAISQCRDNIAELARAEAEASANATAQNAQGRSSFWEGFNQWADSLNDKLISVGHAAGNAVQKIGGLVTSGIKRLASGALNAARTGVRALGDGLKKLASGAVNATKSMLGLNKKHSELGTGLKHGFMTILKYAFGIRSLYFLFRKLRQALTESIKTLAQQDSATAASLNSLSAALNTLKASFGAAFAPILNAIAPMLTTLINLCTKAANAIGALFAALTGAKTFKVATAGADSLSKSTGSAAKNAKELKTQLAGFDELEVLSDDKDSDSGGGGGGGGAVSYEDMEIPDWAKRVKELFDAGEWEELADMLTNKLNDVVNSVDWAGIGDKLGYWFNGALTFLARAITGFDWYNLAAKLAEMLNHVMYAVDWENLGKILVSKLYIMLRSIAGFLQNFDWEYFTKCLYDVLQGAIFGIDWVQVADDLLKGLATAFNGLASGLSKIDFGDLARRISERISSTLSLASWGDVAAGLSNLLHNAMVGATQFLKNIDANAIIQGLKTFLSNVVKNIDIVKLANDLKDLIVAFCDKATEMIKAGGDYSKMGSDLWKWFSNAIKSIDWATLAESIFNLLGTAIGAASALIGQFIKDAVDKIFEYLRSFVKDRDEDGKITGKEILQGILEGISEAIKGISEWIKEHIWTPFVNSFKSVFGIHSPAETMKEPGQMVGEGILEGIGAVFKAINEWIKEHIFDPIVNGAKEGINAIKEVFSGVGETVSTAIDSGKEWVSNTWDNFLGIFSDKKPDVYPTEEAKAFKTANDELTATLTQSNDASFNALGAYEQLSSTISSLKGKTNLTKQEMDLLLQSERLLADLTAKYGDELERQGIIVDQNATSVQNAASAVSDEARAVSDASAETQQLNRALDDSSTVYGNASNQATQYGTNMDTAGAKSETSAKKVEASAESIQTAMVEASNETADMVLQNWDKIESETVEFSSTMETAIFGVINAISVFTNELSTQLSQCVSTVVSAVSQMVAAWNTDWGTPHFHMPIFSMSGVFDLQTGQAPQVIISGWQWMARGGIVDGATLIGAGEDGREAIIPLERHTEWIDLVADGLIERLTSNNFLNRLAEAFLSVPTPVMASGSIIPPNSLTTTFGDGLGESLIEEIRALRSEITALANQPIEVSSNMYLDRREVGRAVTEYQRSEARARG